MANELPNVEITNAPEKKVNPLSNYYRQPKLYIKLPSKGAFYPQGALDVAENGDYAVYAMTAKDELLLKTPDALLSGESTVQVIKSCMPSILNPWAMPSIDVDAALIAIRIATYGETMDVIGDCPACKEDNKYGIPLTQFLNKVQAFTWESEVDVPPLRVIIKPYTYKEMTNTNIKALEQQRLLQIAADNKMSEKEKLEKFNKGFVALSEMTVDTIVHTIERIESPEGSVSDKDLIKDFINNAPKETFDAIVAKVGEMKEDISMPAQSVKCEKCQEEFTLPITMDQSNFFAARS